MSPAERFDLLVERYLDGTLSESDRREFTSSLGARPEARERFCATLALDAALRLPRLAAGAAPASRRRTWKWAAAAILLAGIVAVVWRAWGPGGAPPLARIERVERAEARFAAPRVEREDGLLNTAAAGVSLAAGDRLVTGHACVTFRSDRDGLLAVVQPHSRLRFPREGARERLAVEAGVVQVDAAPPSKGRPIVLLTTHGAATVVGTRFTLVVDAKETILKVERGTVELANRSGEGRVRVGTGQQARTDGAAPPAMIEAPPAPLAAPERWRLDLEAARASGAAGWMGTAEADGLAPALDAEWKGPPKAWLLVTPPSPAPGLVRVGPRLKASLTLSLRSPRRVGLMLLVRPPDQPAVWTSNLQAIRDLPAGDRQEVVLSWGDFQGAAGSAPDATIGLSVFQIFLQTWGDDAGGLRLHALEIESPKESGKGN